MRNLTTGTGCVGAMLYRGSQSSIEGSGVEMPLGEDLLTAREDGV
jgi:hypothetical protein